VAAAQAAPASAEVIGPPSFGTPIQLDALTNSARSVAVGDFNHDGRQDIASTSTLEGLGVHLALSGGGYGPVTRYAAPTASFGGQKGLYTLLAADLNADGNTDLVSQDARGDGIDIVWIGNGDGTFMPAAGVALNLHPGCGSSSSNPCQAAFPDSIVIGDFNEDGKLDLVTAAPNTHNVVRVRGAGDGTFGAPTYTSLGIGSYGVTIDPITIASADINGDGHLDIAAVDSKSHEVGNTSQGSDIVAILLANGDGTFSGPTELHTGTALQSSLVLTDLNEDGHPDLAVLNSGAAATIGVMLNDGHGGFAGPLSVGLDGATGASGSTIADVTGDGLNDVVTANVNALGKDVSVFVNTTRLSASIGSTLDARIPAYVALEGGSAGFGDVVPAFTAKTYIATAALKVATTSPSGVRVSVVADDPGNVDLGGLGPVQVIADVNLADDDDLAAWFSFAIPVGLYQSRGPVNTTRSITYGLQVAANKVLRRGDTYSEPITYTATSSVP
jgi:hypothetical protein